VEVRDPCTHGHHHRVTLYAREILKAFDPEGRFLSSHSLAVGTRQMDIGMIGVSDEIRLKAGPLTPEEEETLQEHPRIGRRILQAIVEDEAALEVVTWHHERWDGSGYPDGLMEEAIPLAARIAAVADSLDALTCCRAHRKALEWKDAVAQIRRESGEKFDPAIVAAFEKALPTLMEIWENLGEQGRPSPVDLPH
jgi:HD-GYP domain-containing protein (c-di-GMP phosphodiesterase class II)